MATRIAVPYDLGDREAAVDVGVNCAVGGAVTRVRALEKMITGNCDCLRGVSTHMAELTMLLRRTAASR
jgi:hypothetical protein